MNNLRNVRNHPILIGGPVFGENRFDFVFFFQMIQREVAHHHAHFASIQFRFIIRSVDQQRLATKHRTIVEFALRYEAIHRVEPQKSKRFGQARLRQLASDRE